MTRDEELQTWGQWQQSRDPQLKKALLKSLTPVLRSQVNKFTNSGLPEMALELEAKKLASKALDTYDPTKSQLNTHVINNLKKLSRFTTTYQNVGEIPEHRALLIGKYNAIYANLEDEKGREPTVEELADAMHITHAEVVRLQSELRNTLQMELTGSDDEPGGFFEYILPGQENPDTRKFIDYLYYDSDPTDKKIIEFTIPGYGSQQLNHSQIKQRLNLTEDEYKKRREKLTKQINKFL